MVLFAESAVGYRELLAFSAMVVYGLLAVVVLRAKNRGWRFGIGTLLMLITLVALLLILIRIAAPPT